MLASYQGVIAADTGHVSLHEAGAIEYGGHKVLQLPHKLGKISAEQIAAFLDNFAADANHDHMVMPGMVYLSHPTEYGTLYSKQELQTSMMSARLIISRSIWMVPGWPMRWPARPMN
jgi:threonine aldolase